MEKEFSQFYIQLNDDELSSHHETPSLFDRYPHIISKGKKKIYGEIYRPENRTVKQPIVIASHGYNGCSEHMRNELERIAAKGIAVYAYDFCGGGNNSKSSGNTYEMTIPTEQNDLIDVVDEVLSFDWVDTDNIYLYGASQGGFVTALTASQVSDSIRGLFLVFPAFCIPYDWAERKASNHDEYIDFWGMRLGKCFVDELPDYDVYERATEYKGPVYIFHGDSDPVVSLEYSRKLADKYNNAQLYIFSKQGHGFEDRYLDFAARKIYDVVKRS